MNKKNLLRICVYVVGVLVITILNLLLFRMIPSQAKFFSTIGMVRYVITILIYLIVFVGINFTLRKYGAQITPTPKTKMIGKIIAIALLVFLVLSALYYMNK